MTNTEKIIQDLDQAISFQKDLQNELFKQRELNGSFSNIELDCLKNSYISESALCKAKFELIKMSLPEYLKEEI